MPVDALSTTPVNSDALLTAYLAGPFCSASLPCSDLLACGEGNIDILGVGAVGVDVLTTTSA